MNTTTQEPLVYSVNGAAAAAGISRGTIYNAISDGELVPLKIGPRTLIERADLLAWLTSKRTTKAAAA